MRIQIMKKRLFSVLSASVLMTTAVCSAAPSVSAEEDGMDILILGDSISSGYALQDGEHGFYDYLSDCLNATVTNLAVPGDTTTDLLKVIADAANQQAIENADLICISIGGNDLLKPAMAYFESLQQDGEGMMATVMRLAQEDSIDTHISNLTGELSEPNKMAQANVAQIEADLRALNADAQIVMQSIYNPMEMETPVYNGKDYSEEYKLLTNYINGQIRRINRAIEALETVTYADVYTAFTGTGWLYVRTAEMDVHPNALGHALIGAVILDAAYSGQSMSSAYFNEILDGMTDDAAKKMPADDRAVIEQYLFRQIGAVFGDVDGDSKVTIKDALATLQAATAIMSQLKPDLSDEQLLIADVDGSGTVKVVDAQYILRYYADTMAKIECNWRDLTKNPNAPDYSNLS